MEPLQGKVQRQISVAIPIRPNAQNCVNFKQNFSQTNMLQLQAFEPLDPVGVLLSPKMPQAFESMATPTAYIYKPVLVSCV